MAAGPVNVLNIAMRKIGAAEIDLDGDGFHVVLCTSTQPLAPNFAGASGQALYADLTAELIGTGYVRGGKPLENVTWTRSTAVVTFAADSTSWSALTGQIKYAVICKVVGAGLGDILAVVDLETTEPTGRTSAGGDFIINWIGGLFTLTRV